MVYLGYRDARLCRAGPDGGVDVSASGAAAQVKAGDTPTGRPIVQQIYGIADQQGKKAVLFTVAGVTGEAAAWADQAQVAVFQLDLAGQVRALNGHAQEMLTHAEGGLTAWQAVAAELECRLAAGEEASITAELVAPSGQRGFWGIWIRAGGTIQVTRDIAGSGTHTVKTVKEAVTFVEGLVERLGAIYEDSQVILTVAGTSRPFQPRLSYPETPGSLHMT